MNDSQPFLRADFDRLLADHQEAIRLMNELEFELYRLGDNRDGEHAVDCQRAGGTLLGFLRGLLFRHDQQVFPILEALVQPEPAASNGCPEPMCNGEQ